MLYLMFTLFAQVAKSPDERLVNSFNSFVTAISVQIAVISAIAAILAIAVPIYLNQVRQRTQERIDEIAKRANTRVEQAIEDIDRIVERRVYEEVAFAVRRRTQFLEQLLEREATIEQTAIDYYMPNPKEGLPEAYRLLVSRGFEVTPRYSLDLPLRGNIIVVDLVHHQNSNHFKDADNDDVEKNLKAVTQKMEGIQPELILIVYVPGQFECIRQETIRRKYFASANFLIPFVGTVVNAAYIANAIKTQNS